MFVMYASFDGEFMLTDLRSTVAGGCPVSLAFALRRCWDRTVGVSFICMCLSVHSLCLDMDRETRCTCVAALSHVWIP